MDASLILQSAPSLWSGLSTGGLPAPELIVGAGVVVGLLAGPPLLRRAMLGSPNELLGPGTSPGVFARKRAEHGVEPDENGWDVGYASWHSLARVAWPQLRLGGVILGAPGSGKTTALENIARTAHAAGAGLVLVDPKASPSLRRTVQELGGTIWTIGGDVLFDPLEADAEVLADQLLEGEPEDRNAPRVFRGGARLAVQQLGRALAIAGQPPELRRVIDMLRGGDWMTFVRKMLGPEYVPLNDVERDGVKTFAAGLAGLMLSPAGRSLGSGPGAIRLSEVLDKGQMVLFSLDGNLYHDTARRVGGWVFLGLKAQIGRRLTRKGPPCVIAVDEAHQLGWTGRLAVDLLATGRESGLPVILSSQGPSDLSNLGEHLLARVAQDAAWILAFRQGPLDSAITARMLGVRAATATSRRSDGMTTTHWVEATGQAMAAVGERVAVPPSVLENLETGDAWLRVPPAHGARGQLQLVRVLLPRKRQTALSGASEPVLAAVPVTKRDSARTDLSDDERWSRLPPHVQQRIERKGVDECWPGKGKPHPNGYLRVSVDNSDEWMANYVYVTCVGPMADDESVDHVCHTRALRAGKCRGGVKCPHKRCMNWHHFEAVSKPDNTRRRWETDETEDGTTDEAIVEETSERPAQDLDEVHSVGQVDTEPLGEPATAKEPSAAGRPQRQALAVDERRAEVQRLKTAGLSMRDIAQRLGIGLGTVQRDATASVPTVPVAVPAVPRVPLADVCFAIALFARYDRPAVTPSTVSLEDLVAMLTTSHEFADKRQARCWSPTLYADGAKSRANAGVAAVSALVFDLDRVPPDPERLKDVYWIGHTTWSHTPTAPRWRVVIPLTTPVPAAQWRDVWQRARAALCPEADPSCKDPSRQYYLPSHSGGVTAQSTRHDGPLLDPNTLPPLPPEPKRPELRRLSSTTVLRAAATKDRRRAEAYMGGVIDKLAGMAPNTGRNAALNGAAWTLGGWIAAGALEHGAVEDALYSAAESNGLVADDGHRPCWATIRSGLSAGLQQPIDLDADDRPPVRRRRAGA